MAFRLPHPRDHNLWRKPPTMPGVSLPATTAVPMAYIHRPSPSVTQSGPGRKQWVLEFEPTDPPFPHPVMGWTGSADPFAHIQVSFPDLDSAVSFAERHGWRFQVEESPKRKMTSKNFSDKFKCRFAGSVLIARHYKEEMP
ncbi:hypothetical protein Sp245p_19140 (plasmid) [Azospirillum baldaniorum]|uniref:Uncharacterized protein n=3 Tax=Azospirillum TaxID=191 RepID=A0A2K1FTD3_9PROT|nr:MULTISPECIES: NADH dehydrogenase ubiquinone Fe-S protein 4 [Azospirillum]TWA73905.1 ETC complex I subunit-like protein [Azospirillum brasilense]AWJ91915.1 hypothetical protein Sp245p_19140 [Azospirillum baldaniorum]KAA1052981.1 NADH-ubiquinone oxidoreductase-related protein [Azospirillum argentinense]PNQ95729.1 hypothetical protein C1S70_27200 [Azospirillum argentinense]CCD00335.1 protein of unknown function [Azospirillum baldaniorum]